MGKVLAAQSTIVYADLGRAAPQTPSAVAAAIAQQARESLSAGQYDVALKPLSEDEVKAAIRAMPTGHERLALDSNLILLGAGALIAYAPYRARVVLASDPFARVETIGQLLDQDTDTLRVRIHDALIAAERIVCLSGPPFEAVAPLVSRRPEDRMYPTIALAAAAGNAPLLVVANEDERSAQEMLSQLSESFPAEEFCSFDPAAVFDTQWKAVIQLGIARSSLPGARLSDAWAGGVPVLQLVNRTSLTAQSRRLTGVLAEYVVDHGRTGLPALRAGGADRGPARLPARSAADALGGARSEAPRRSRGAMDTLLKAVLQ